MIEFVWLVLLVMVPLVYVLLADFDVVYVRAASAAQVALADQGMGWVTAGVQVSCAPTPGRCLAHGSAVSVAVTEQQLVPDVQWAVAEYVRATGAGVEHPSLAWQVSVTGPSVTVRVSTPLDLPLDPACWADTTTVVATGSAVVQVS